MVKMLTVLVSTISNSQVFLLKTVSSFSKCKSYSHFFSKNISIYGIFNDQSFNDMLTKDIVGFEQLGPGVQLTFSASVTSYKIYVSVFKDAEADYMSQNLLFGRCFENFNITAIRQVSGIDHLNLNQKSCGLYNICKNV